MKTISGESHHFLLPINVLINQAQLFTTPIVMELHSQMK